MHGREVPVTELEMELMATGYDRKTHAAPLVIGHPADNRPAYGEVLSFVAAGPAMFAIAEVNDELVSAVRAKRYVSVSTSYWQAGQKFPYPYVRHVGFLGAMPPAVKGMQPIDFSAADEETAVSFATISGKVPSSKCRETQLFTATKDLQRAAQNMSFTDAAILVDRAMRTIRSW